MGVGKTTFTFSNSSISIDGGSTNINLTRDNQSYTNKLSHGYGDIYTFPAGATDYTWAPTAAQLSKFFQETPSQKLRPIDVYLDTYNGSTKVGRDTHTLQVVLSEATGKPTISNFTITDSNSAAGKIAIVVEGKSNLTAGATITPKYGASIVKTTYAYGKITSGTTAITNGGFSDINSLVASLPLTETPTDYVIRCVVGDSRGFSNTAYVTKSFVKYQAPHIDNFEVVRRDTSGNEDENGTKALVIIKGGWSAMRASGSTTDKNTATLKVGYKTTSATSYTYRTITVTGGTVDVIQTLNVTLTPGADYVFSVQLTDAFETYTESGIGCSNVQNILYVSADGNELVMGSDASNNVLIDPNGVSIRDGSTVNATFTKDKIELGKNNTDSTISMKNDTVKIETGTRTGTYDTDIDRANLDFKGEFAIRGLTSYDQNNTYDANMQIWGYGDNQGTAGGNTNYLLLNNAMEASGGLTSAANITLSSNIVLDNEEANSAINMRADHLYLYGKTHVSGGFTEDVSVMTSGNCNALTETGKYYIGSSGTNKPVSDNGWLECKKYSTNYCYQTYYAYTGHIYRRVMMDGTWGGWVSTTYPKSLWNGSLSAGGSITVKELAKYALWSVDYGTGGLRYSMIGAGPVIQGSYLTVATQVDTGSNSYVLKATFYYTASTGKLSLTSASDHLLASGVTGRASSITGIYGIC